MKHDYSKIAAAVLAAAGLAAALPASAQEQTPAPSTAPAPVVDEEATQQHAIANINLIVAALRSTELDQGVKDVLVSCIYSNSIRDITVAMDETIAANPGQFDRADTNSMLSVMAAVCGYQAPASAAEPAADEPSR